MGLKAIVGVLITVMVLSESTIAQSLNGFVKEDKAFIQVEVPEEATVKSIVQKWGVAHAVDTNAEGKLLLPVMDLIRQFSCEGCVPVYHKVQSSEGLYRIGKWYGNIGVGRLKTLNQLRSETLQKGQRLLVGYILPGADWVPSPAKVAANISETTIPEDAPLLTYAGPGFFMQEWQPPIVEKVATGKAASFKSESGWSDGKFYILHNQYSVGSIVKITHPETNKYLFAKVVGPLPELKMNNGLIMRMNNAAAAFFGIWDESTFDVSIGF